MALILSGDTGPSFVQSAAMPSGSVIQTVQASTAANTLTGINAPTYVATGLTATITPRNASSKIMIIMMARLMARNPTNGESGNGIRIVRNGTSVFSDADGYDNFYYNMNSNTYINNIRNTLPITYTDSPGTTAALTYTLYINSYIGQVVFNADGQTSTIQLLEIAG
jgi:hypothetical protein